MIENLRLDATDSRGTSNIGLSRGYGGNFIGLADSETTNFGGGTITASNSLYSTDIIIGDHQGYRFPRYNNSNTANRDADATGTGNTYSYGNYYSWPAAIANTSDYVASQDPYNVVNTSICPSGWRLATGGTDGEYVALNIALGGHEAPTSTTQDSAEISNQWRSFPNNIVLSGMYVVSSPVARNQAGEYWSSTIQYSSGSSSGTEYMDAREIMITPGAVRASTTYAKFYGVSCRPLADCIMAEFGQK